MATKVSCRLVRTRTIVAVLATGLLAGLASAQAPSSHFFRAITVNDGLSQGFVNAVEQDSKGFMWFGTNDGLNRYDGYSIKVYRPAFGDSLAIRDAVILSLLDDGRGRMWIGTIQGHIQYLDLRTERQTTIPIAQGRSIAEPIRQLHQDREGVIWARTSRSLLRYDSLQRRFETFAEAEGSGADEWSLMAERSDGTLWLLTSNRGLVKIPPDRRTMVAVRVSLPAAAGVPANGIVSIAFDRTGGLWLAYPTLVAVISPEELRLQDGASQPTLAVRSIHNVKGTRMMAEDGDGAMWVVPLDLDNSFMIDTRSDAITAVVPHVSNASPTTPLPVTCLRADRSGDMWLGTNGLGMVHQARSYGRFSLLTHENELTIQSLRSIEEDHDGNLWVAGYGSGDGAGLNRLDARTGATVTYRFGTGPMQLTSRAFWTLLADPADDRRTMWLGADGYSGVSRMRPPYRTVDRVTPADQNLGAIRSLYRDQRGRLWTGTTAGLHRIDDQRLRSNRPVIDQRGNTADVVRTLTSSTVLHITELSATPDLLWCSTEAGLLCFDPATGRGTLWQASDQPSALRSSLVLSVHEDRQGRVWVATGGAGIAQAMITSSRTAPLPAISEVTFRHYTSSEGLPNDYVYGILDGDHDELWMSTNAGIVRFNPATGSFRSYDVVDGLQNNEFNKNAFFRSKSGELFFGGVMGLNRFYPSAITDNPHVPEIVVTDLKVFNRSRTFPVSISWLDEVVLNADDRVITFEFVALDYRVSARNRYRYQLEGFDSRWIENGTSRTATYTDLDPGTYTFHVTGTNNDGVWNPTGTSIRLVMLPPFWKTWWFRGISLALLAGALYGGFHVREREMARRHRELEDRVRERTAEWEAANSELEAFSYTVSHDLRAPVRAINGYTKMLLQEHASELTPDALRKLDVIAARTKRMGTMIDDLLTFSRLGRQALVPTSVDMTALVRGLAQELVPVDSRVTVQVGQLPTAYVDPSLLRQVWINLLSNAVKFSSSAERPVVTVGGHGRGNAVVYWVKDNGVGFDMMYAHKLFGVFERLHSQEEFEGTGVGLAIVARVIKRHGGRVWAESQPGQGATFSFEIPIVPPASA